MAYRFKLKESFRKGVRRIAVSQLDRAIKELAPEDGSGSNVHEGRKAIKRLRALLRLVKPSIGKKSFTAHNSALRAAASQLSGARDQQVLVQTVAKLHAASPAGARLTLSKLLQSMQMRLATSQLQHNTVTKHDVLRDLTAEREKFSGLSCHGSGFAIVEDGLTDCYRDGREKLDVAFESGDDEAFHDLRKGVQLHWRHMALLSAAWPELFAVRVASARELSQILGDEHDLSVLISVLPNEGEISHSEADVIVSIVGAKKAELRKSAEARARRLFAERPNDFTDRVKLYWNTAHDLPKSSAGVDEDAVAEADVQAAPASVKPKTSRSGRSRQTR